MIIVCTFILFFSNLCNLLQEVLEYDATLKGFQQQQKKASILMYVVLYYVVKHMQLIQ